MHQIAKIVKKELKVIIKKLCMCNNKKERSARTLRLECLSYLNHCETQGCFFVETLYRDNQQKRPYVWDEIDNGISTIVANSQGNPKVPIKLSKRTDRKMAKVQIAIGDYVIRSWVLPKRGGRRATRVVCLVYQVSDICDTTKVLQVVNIGIAANDKVFWKSKIASSLQKATYRAFCRAEYYNSARPFVSEESN